MFSFLFIQLLFIINEIIVGWLQLKDMEDLKKEVDTLTEKINQSEKAKGKAERELESHKTETEKLKKENKENVSF